MGNYRHALYMGLDYCNVLYVILPLKMTWKMQLVQNTAAGMLSNSPRFPHAMPLIQELHRLPVVVRVQFKVLVLSYTPLYGLGPGDLRNA